MTEAVLSDLFTFSYDSGNSAGDDYSFCAEADKTGVTLSTADGARSVFTELPFTADSLRAAACELLSQSKDTRFICDKKTGTVIFGDSSVKLTPTELRLFSAFLENGAKPVTAEELSLSVWGTCNKNLCTVYLSYLRRKLDFAFGDGCLICIRGKGYRLRDADN